MTAEPCPDGQDFEKSRRSIGKLPMQWTQLRSIIGDRHAGLKVNIRHQKPEGTVLLNLHIDALTGAISDGLLTAAEVLADTLKILDKDGRKRDPAEKVEFDDKGRYRRVPATVSEQNVAAARIITPRLSELAKITGVGGRSSDDPLIDVMFWVRSGVLHGVKQTTGAQMITHLDHLGALAHFTLGQTRARIQRDLPCTRCAAKTVGRWAGSEMFDCTNCGSQFHEDELRRQDKILLELHKRGILQQRVGNA